MLASKWWGLLREWWLGSLELVFPPQCWLCQGYAGTVSGICQGCEAQFRELADRACWRCGRSVGPFADVTGGCAQCRSEHFPYRSVKRLGRYEGILREAALRLKHVENEGLAIALGRFLGQLLADSDMQCDAIVPVPLHWWRRLQRGYNQAQALAEGISDVLKKPLLARALVRIRPTPIQSGKSVTQRQENVKGAFRARLTPGNAPASVLLVDDVMTTGSTASEAARELRRAGVHVVHVAVLARAES